MWSALFDACLWKIVLWTCTLATLFVLMMGCQNPQYTTRWGVDVYGPDVPSRDSVEAAFLATDLWARTVAEDDHTRRAYKRYLRGMDLYFQPELIYCADCESQLAVGAFSHEAHRMVVTWPVPLAREVQESGVDPHCLANSALVHELAHVWLRQTPEFPEGDHAHESVEFTGRLDGFIMWSNERLFNWVCQPKYGEVMP